MSAWPQIEFTHSRPTVKGQGIRCEVIYRRFADGESVFELAEDYKMHETQIEAAIRWQVAWDTARKSKREVMLAAVRRTP